MRGLNKTMVPVCVAAAWLAVSSLPVQAQQVCPAVKADCLQPMPMGDAAGARFAWGSTGGKNADAWVARFDRGAKEATWRVVLGGGGEDSVSTVTLGYGGADLFVAGATTSASVTGFAGRNAGGRDGFVARLDAATGRVLGGAFVGGAGDEELTGVVQDQTSNVLIAGVGTLVASGAPPATLAVVEPTSASGNGLPVFVATLDRALVRQQAVFPIGSIRVKRPRIWIDCHGNIVIGVVAMGGTGCSGNWPNLVYEQDQITQDYDIDHDWNNPLLGFPPGGWGFHALRWKEYHANSFLPVGDPPYVLDWTLVPVGVDVPKLSHPGCTEGGTLNGLETNVFLKNGVPVDPPGGWMCGNHADVAQLALYSAHFFHRWGTPVYTHLGYWDNLNGPWTWYTSPVALERVTFEPWCPINPNGYNGETLDDLCDLGVNNVNDLTCTSSIGIPGVSGGSFFLRFDNFEGAEWGLDLVWWARLTGWQRDISWFWQEWYEAGEYLMDPPPGSSGEVAVLQEAARQSADRVVRKGTVKVTQLAKGVKTCEQTVEAVLPASE
jgi:hypothetical protein